ncbi:VQ motif-containing protein 8, chloroplastic [Manihot esculenta]|uniref:VQ domain-containing protein n=1 Tax=Manihot esculenta TaxID=3983 RepID=A0A2C9UKJ6_MANES|nr:VQ motif-containing protein 8, chloroplastic [Manihot esculenta]OAY31329.1 hypothetical protein MANES_14G103400v8 [Manihot esculenta]
MSPAKFNHQQNIINGLRPSPLKINKESHLIHKLSSSSSSSTTSNSSPPSASVIAPAGAAAGVKQGRNQPVIIYTHSPKVIHTQARDFMALVQKLTGLSSSKNDETTKATQQGKESGGFINNKGLTCVGSDDKESSPISTDGNYGGGGAGDVSPILNPPKNPCFADIPLFTPNSVDFFCSPRPVYRYSDVAYASPSIGNSISPSVMEFMKGLPEY